MNGTNYWSSSLWSLLHLTFSPLLAPNIHLRILFSNTLSLRSSLNVRDHASQPCSTTGNIVLYYLVLFAIIHYLKKDICFESRGWHGAGSWQILFFRSPVLTDCTVFHRKVVNKRSKTTLDTWSTNTLGIGQLTGMFTWPCCSTANGITSSWSAHCYR